MEKGMASSIKRTHKQIFFYKFPIFTENLFFSILYITYKYQMELIMKLANILVLAVAAIVISACGGNNAAPKTQPAPSSGIINPPSEFCYFTSLEPQGGVEYELLRNVALGKGTYGSVKDVVPPFEELTVSRGGNAVINFTASQRFGFWPWRIVRPVARGRAIKITNTQGLSCKQMGGLTQAEIMEGKR